MSEENRSQLAGRAEYIEALPPEKRRRLLELIRRGDMLNFILDTIEDHPGPSEGIQAKMVEFLEVERDEARARQSYTERAWGVPELESAARERESGVRP